MMNEFTGPKSEVQSKFPESSGHAKADEAVQVRSIIVINFVMPMELEAQQFEVNKSQNLSEIDNKLKEEEQQNVAPYLCKTCRDPSAAC